MRRKIIIILLAICYSTCYAEENINNDSKKYIILARHGQTDYNAKKLLTGRGSNPDLNEEGESQALALAHNLNKEFTEGKKIELIVSSNMKRTNQTAEIVNQHFSIPMVYNANLQEVHRGGLEGRPLSEVLPILEGLKDHEIHPEHGGESTLQFRTRVVGALCEYLNAPEKIILVVAHGYVGETAHHYFKEESIKLGNSEYIVFTHEDLADKCNNKDYSLVSNQ